MSAIWCRQSGVGNLVSAIWCWQLDTAIRAVIKRRLHLPPRTCTQYLYLSQVLGGMGIPSVEDESHVARSAQAFKFLSNSRDVRVRNVAINQLVATEAKRAPYLDPTDPGHLERWLSISAGPLEGRAGDLQSLWSAVQQSLILTSSFIRLTKVTPEKVVSQFIRTKRTAPGVDGITYANWRWVDPKA